MSNKRGADSQRILESQERPPKRKTLSAYFGGGNVGKGVSSWLTSPVHVEDGDSSQVGDHVEEVQVVELKIISVEDELEHDSKLFPLSRDSQNDTIDLGEKTKSDAINNVCAQKGKKKWDKKKNGIYPEGIFN